MRRFCPAKIFPLKYQAFALRHTSREQLRDTVLGISCPPLYEKELGEHDVGLHVEARLHEDIDDSMGVFQEDVYFLIL